MATQEELLQRGYDEETARIRSRYGRARRELADKFQQAEEKQETNLEARGILRSGEAQTGRARLLGQRTTGETDLETGEVEELNKAQTDYLTRLAQLQSGGGGGGSDSNAPTAPSTPSATTTPSLPSGSPFAGFLPYRPPSLPSGSPFAGFLPYRPPSTPAATRPPGLSGSADTMERKLTTPTTTTRPVDSSQVSQVPNTVYVPGIGTFAGTPTTTTKPATTVTKPATTVTKPPTTVTKPTGSADTMERKLTKPTVTKPATKPAGKTIPVGRL